MPSRSSRVARIIRQRRKHRSRRYGTAGKLGAVLGCGFGTVFTLIVGGLLVGVGGILGVYAIYARQLPPPEAIISAQAENFQTTIFYDRTGTYKIYEAIDPNGGDREYITLDEMPDHLLWATIAIEDARFYSNPGFDPEGILRAALVNVTSDQVQGASTITQQLVRNQLLSQEERNAQTVDRKLKEIILAAELSRLYSKDQILEWYLNTNFYGNLAYGVEAASQVYFDKSARELTLAEAALIAAIPQSPGINPLDNPELAVQRQRVVLDEMLKRDFITQAEYDGAITQQIVLRAYASGFNPTAPHFALYARNEAETILDNLGLDGSDLILGGGLRIYTTLDVDLQRQLECVARSHVGRLNSNDPTYGHNTNNAQPCVALEFLPPPNPDTMSVQRTVNNASGIILKGNTGEIVAMLGSLDFWNAAIGGQVNVSIAQRQPASTFKPFVYVTAFINPIGSSRVITPATMTYDVLTEFDNGGIEPYVPYNIDRRFNGPVSIRTALARSYNVPAVQVLNWVGLRSVLTTAHSMGINSMNDNISNYGLALALGTAEASLLDMTYAYNVFNNNGYMVGSPVSSLDARAGYRQLNPVAILRIEDANGRILWEYNENVGTYDRRAVLEPGMAYMITDILSDNDARHSSSFPPGNALEISRPAAVKTGTSDDFRDSWTIGYTPQYTVGIWVGNSDSSTMTDITGLTGAAPIWHAMMEYINVTKSLPIEVWERPSTIVSQDVCMLSGLLPNGNCPTVGEIFYYDPSRGIDYRPQQVDPFWVSLRVNTCNNTLAVASSPQECVAERDYFQYPNELQEWATVAGVDVAPTLYDTANNTPLFSAAAIFEPELLAHVRGAVVVRGNAVDDALDFYRLEIGQGNAPSAWQQIGSDGREGGANISLGTWDTTQLPDGLYVLRLTVIRTDGTSEFATREVIVDNTPPTVSLVSPIPNRTYSATQDVYIEISAEPSDNRQTAYVDFYIDGELVASTTESPYIYRWEIAEGRQEPASFWVVVGDRAGNETTSTTAIVQLAP